MKRKIISLAMACICAITSFSLPVINVSAAETENVTETLSIDSDEIEEQKTEDCIVNADISGSFTITIPKKMILSGNDKKGSYEVTAKGDIAATEVINVVPEEKFVLSSTGKEDVETSVSQLKKAFSYSDVMKTEDGILVGSTTSGEVTSDNLTSGEWKGSFYFNINMAKVSRIGVTAIDGNQTDLNASAYTIEGTEKDALLEKLISSGITDTVTSADDVDALIEVESDDFDNIAKTTFDVSNITEDGDKVVILHYNEETNEWEYIGAYEVVDGEVTADFTSFSPVAFVVVQSDGTLHIHEYVVTEEVEATCTTGGSKVYTCECGDSYTEEIEALGHTVGAETCPVCGDEIEYTAFALGSSNYSQAGITREGDVVIPQYFEYNGTYYEVTSIDYGAFYNCTDLTSITIPDSVTSIGNDAFRACISLSTITIPEGVTSISNKVFEDCLSLTSIEIPNSVTTIGNYAFKTCASLTNITIPDSVTSIGSNAFYNSTNLVSIDIPNSVTSIGLGAFSSCTSLAKVTIPDSVTSIGANAFYGCTALEKIEIPDGVKSIDDGTFYNCTSLANITIPNSVASIRQNAFQGCTRLTTIYIPSSVTTISASKYSYSPFYKCSSSLKIYCEASAKQSGWGTYWNYYSSSDTLSVTYSYQKEAYEFYSQLSSDATEVTIPDGMTVIPDKAFYGFKSLTDVTIPDSVTSIGSSAFSGCSSLESVEIPDSVTSINNYVFRNCTSLTNITISDSVTSIGQNAFKGCTALTSIYIPSSVTTISASVCDYSPFSNCSSSLKIYCGASEAQSGWGTYWNYSALSKLSVAYGVTREEYEFYSQLSSDVTEVTIPDGITLIPNNAFYEFKSLTDVTIPDSITSIGTQAFYNCTSLTDVTIPDSVTFIEEKAFYNCKDLTTIYIPSSITSITATKYYNSPFTNCSSTLKIYCGASAKQSGWGTYWNYYDSGKTLSTTYNVTREEYEANYK